MQKQEQHYVIMKNLCVSAMQDRHRERERERERERKRGTNRKTIFQIATITT